MLPSRPFQKVGPVIQAQLLSFCPAVSSRQLNLRADPAIETKRKLRAIPRTSARFREVPRSSAKFREIPRCSAFFRVVPHLPENDVLRTGSEKKSWDRNRRAGLGRNDREVSGKWWSRRGHARGSRDERTGRGRGEGRGEGGKEQRRGARRLEDGEADGGNGSWAKRQAGKGQNREEES